MVNSKLPKARLVSFASLFLFILFFVPANIFATVLIHKNLEELVQNAEEIFEGKVVSQESKISDNGKTIYTLVTFSRVDTLRGETPQSTITLRFEGGQVGDEGLTVVGMPTFGAGEKVILFVKQNTPQRTICPVEGWIQGKFTVETDPKTGKEFMRNGQGEKLVSFDNQKQEFITEKEYLRSRVISVPSKSKTEKPATSISQATPAQLQPPILTKEAFKTEIIKLIQKQQVKGTAKATTTTKQTTSSQVEWKPAPSPEVR